MFIVKATYRGETRKLSFSTDAFPSFEQLCNQLYRVFPISHSYYLSKLLFSPKATQGGRILIGREVHNQEDYNKTIKPYKDRVWPQGLLRLTVYDETPHKSPNKSAWSSFDSTARSSHFISPPPILYPTPSSSSAMDVDKGTEENKGKGVSSRSCCSVQSTKAEVQRLITDFKEDLDHVLKATFTSQEITSPSPPLSVVPLYAPSTLSLNVRGVHNGPAVLCSGCARQVSSWNICGRCHLVECDDCSGKTNPFCFGTMAGHQWDHRIAGSFPPWFGNQEPSQESSTADSSISMPWPTSIEVQSHRNRNDATPVARPAMSTLPNDSSIAAPSVRPVIHHGVICDDCENTIEGVRHKCLDCPDFDLCMSCMNSGGTERHNPFHEFFEIATPGRVVVHRVYDREPSSAEQTEAPEPSDDVIHHAICDLCDSHIRGDRYKCLDCPDFDTCSSCFRITETQHPRHSFAKLGRSEDYIKRGTHLGPPHHATCNICTKRIYGVRYKCMHADCPDFDLCSTCESHPIALHPDTHPLLKMKTPDSVIPKVCSHKRPPIVDLGVSGNHGSSSASPFDDNENLPSEALELIGNSFIWGFMHAPSVSEESGTQTPPVQPVLIPRLDEISPSVSCTLPAQEARPLPVPPYPSDAHINGDHVLATPLLAGNDEDSRPATPSPIRVSREGEDVSRMLESAAWPGSTAGLERLMRSFSFQSESSHQSEHGNSSLPATVHSDRAPEIAFTSSPLTGEEALLNPPSSVVTDMQQKSSQPVSMSRQTLAMLLGGYQTPASVESFSSAVSQEEASKVPLPKPSAVSPKPSTPEMVVVSPSVELTGEQKCVEGSVRSTGKPEPESAQEEPVIVEVDQGKSKIFLSAMFVEDSTVTDGQIFPPGAEFMKCWRMLNDSEHDWPETTELVYVAGEALGMKKDGVVHVGTVKTGTEVELWTGELKAPDVAGRYVSYWRLRDGDGMLFGDSIWIDIVVADAHLNDDSDQSIASSLVVMPRALPSVTVTSVAEHPVQRGGRGAGTATLTNGTGTPTIASLSLPSSGSGIGSDTDSEVSLVSIPSSDEAEIWEDVGSSIGGATGDRNAPNQSEAIDYVLLYDDRSSEDE